MASALHKLIIGATGTGKTVLATQLVRRSIAKGIPSLILDPKWEAGRWPSGPPAKAPMVWGTSDADKFLAVAQSNRRCLRIIDECDQTIGRHDPKFNVLATDSREAVNVSVFMMQHYADVHPRVRGQCRELFLFYCLQENGDYMRRQFPHPQLSDCIALPVEEEVYSEFFWVRGVRPLERWRLDFATGKLTHLQTYPKQTMRAA